MRGDCPVRVACMNWTKAAFQNLVETPNCWNCGRFVRAVNKYYLCTCGAGQAQGREPLPMFTQPGFSITRTRLTPPYGEFQDPYIDHATQWAPTP